MEFALFGNIPIRHTFPSLDADLRVLHIAKDLRN